MATTYELIASNTLSSSAASVTFSAIPNTFTDLVLKTSVRSTRSDRVTRNFYLQFNGDTSSNYSWTFVSNGGSSRGSSSTFSDIGYIPAGLTTANTFGSGDLYIPNYTVSQNKPFSSVDTSENNSSSDWYIRATANLWRNTAAITSILIYPESDSMASGSSFFLYGIKNS